MKPKLRKILFAASLAAALSAPVSAISITPTSGDLGTTRFEGDQTGQTQINTVIGGIIGNTTELYKQNVGDATDTGDLAGSYVTTFSNTPSDPSEAFIDYVGGAFLQPTAYLLVKDGDQSPAWYLFNLTALNLQPGEDITLTGFWPNQGAISHVALYSSAGSGTTSVPDGGSAVVLLGFSLAALGMIRRKLR